MENSPCIDAGDPDLDGDGLTWENDPDDRDPDGTRLDIGAFYFDQSDSLLHFTPVPPTGLPYSIVVDTAFINNNPLLPGDSIGVFDGTLCVGAVEITGNTSNLNLVAWQADTAYGLAGFTPGNSMTFKILSSLYGSPEVFTPTATFTVGDGTFGSGTYSVVSLGVTTAEIPVLTTPQTNILFGSVPIWTTAYDTLEVYNTGDRNLIINTIQSDHPVFTTTFSGPTMVSPGDTLLVPLAFTPNMITYFTGNLTIESNDADHSPLTIALAGLGTQSQAPVMTGFDWSMNMGAGINGDTVSLDWTFQNAGNDTLKITNIWTDDWHFFVLTTQCQVAPGDFYTIPIYFTPNEKGFYTANLNFSHNDPTLPQSWIQLTGVGYDGHFQPVPPTGLPYLVLTDSIIVDNQPLNVGDEIGVFDGTQCVGVGVQGVDSTLQITTWEADPSHGLAGFTAGNTMSFSFWGNTYGTDREIGLSPNYLQGDGTFGFQPLTLVNLTGSSGYLPSMVLDTTLIYFNPTNVGTSTDRTLYLSNGGNAPLQITNIQSSSPVFNLNPSSLTLPAGALDSVTVTFAPTEPIFYAATLTVYSDDPQQPQVTVPVQGMGVPSLQSHLTLPNPSVTFSPTVIGDTTALQIPIRNDGNRDLTVYTLTLSNSVFQADIQPTTIPPGGVALFDLSFTPLTKGRENALVQVNSNADNGNTHYLSVSGVGYEGFFQPVQPTGLPYIIVVDSIITGTDSSLKVGDEIGVYDDLLCVGAGVIEEIQDSASTGSFYFDGNAGAQDYIETTIYGFDTNIGSIELWVKVLDAPTGDIPLMSITQNNNWSPQAFHLMYRAGGTIHHHTYNNGWTGEWNIYNQWQYNTWHHVALTWNGSNRKIYLDGNLVGENNSYVQPNLDPNSYTMRIGDNPDGSYLHGYIDEFRLWSVELTQGEIQDRLSTTLTGDEYGLIGYWPMGYTSNQYITDQSGNGNTGQIFGDIVLSQDTPPLNYIMGELSSLQITAWEQDLSHGLPGFVPGNSMAFLVRTDLDSLPDFVPETREGIPLFLQGDGSFGAGNLSVLNLTVGAEIDASFFYGSVSGTVTSNLGGPVVGAQVQLYQGPTLTETTLTDSAGFFFMDSIPSNDYTLSVSRFHYSDYLTPQPFPVQKPDTTNLDLVITQIENMVFYVPTDQPTIQGAIDLTLDRDTVIVEPGTYQENLNFNGKNIVLRSLTGPEATILDGNQNGSVVTFESGEDSTAILHGFTLQNGFAIAGGGIYCANNSQPILLDLRIIDNTADDFGGGVYCGQNSSPTIKNTTISGNHVVSTGYNNDGGGVYCASNANPLLENTTIKGNWASLGGGLLASGASPRLVNVIIEENTGSYGGGLYYISSQIVLINVLMTQNTAWYYGGAIHSINSDPLLMNVTISRNTSGIISGGLSCEGSNPILINSILWENTSPEVYFSNLGSPNSLTVTYSNIQFGMDSILTNNNGIINWLDGNITLDPRFIQPDSADFHLLETSYCIGAGIDSVEIDTIWYMAPAVDIEGNPRPNPATSAPDMGAFEHALPVPHTRQLVLAETYHDFGTVQVDSLTSWPLRVYNEGNQPLTILSLQHTNPDFFLSDTTVVIAPADSLDILISCQPTQLGSITDTLRIASDDTDDPDTLQFFPLQVVGIDTVAPNPPANLQAGSAPLAILVNWSPSPEGDLHHYNLYRSESTPADSLFATVYAPDTSFLDTAVVLGQPYYYRLTAVDSLGNESNFSVEALGVAVNYPPQITFITPLEDEQHGLVPITITSLDYEGDSITYAYFFSKDSVQWSLATISEGLLRSPQKKKIDERKNVPEIVLGGRNRADSPDTLWLQWDTNIDLGAEYFDSVFFRLEAADYHDTNRVTRGPFPVDNFVGFLVVDQSNLGGEQSGSVDVPFLIVDPTNDDYSVAVTFSIQNSGTWQAATVPNLPALIGPGNYYSTFTWTTTVDLFNMDTLISLAVTPSDNWQVGGGDTLLLHVDNQVLPLLESITPDTSATLPWYGPIGLTFTGQIDSTTSAQGIVLVGEYSDTIQAQHTLTPQQNMTYLELIPQEPLYAHETVTVTLLPTLKDVMGNPFDGNSNGDPDGPLDTDTLTMLVNLLGDYDQSGAVDFADLVQFQQAWWQDTIGAPEEVGPATGTPPYLQIQPDGVLDFEDLMVFTQMWNWSVGFDYGGRQLAKVSSDTSTSTRLKVLYPQRKPGDPNDEFRLQLQVAHPSLVGALELVLHYNPETMQFQSYSRRLDEPWVVLVHHDEEQHVLIVNLVDLNQESRNLPREWLDFKFKRLVEGETEVQWDLDLRNRQAVILEQSRQTFRFNTTPPLPKVYALHQNYPNPFNTTTTIKYDLPEDTHVRLVIYNLLGQEVVKLRDGQETAGFKSLQWRGVDRQGRPVGAGLYFVVMNTKEFQKSCKLILLK